MQSRSLLVLFCLFFSGLAALVYQVIWTRLLGFAFGTTTEAIGTVLAVFFGGMGIGNWLAARKLSRVERPLRLYAWLELAIGVFAFQSAWIAACGASPRRTHARYMPSELNGRANWPASRVRAPKSQPLSRI